MSAPPPMPKAPERNGSRSLDGRLAVILASQDCIARIIDPDAFRSVEERRVEALERIKGDDLGERAERIARRDHAKMELRRAEAAGKAATILVLLVDAAGPKAAAAIAKKGALRP